MGGSNSGRWGSRKPVAEHLTCIDLKDLARQHDLGVGQILQSSYTFKSGLRVQASVHFEETATRFGGRRLWFRCPACGGRCRVLFVRRSVACRRCHGVRYASQAETRSARANRAMFKIVKRLDPEAEANDFPDKPKGMHWRTYERLADRYEQQDTRWALAIMRRFGMPF